MHPEIKAFEIRFLKDAEKLLNEKFKIEYAVFNDILEKNQSQTDPYPNLLVNTLVGGPLVDRTLQAHMHEIVYPKLWGVGIRTKAYCLGKDIISKMSVEFTVEEAPEGKFQDRFFATLEEAKEWLKSMN